MKPEPEPARPPETYRATAPTNLDREPEYTRISRYGDAASITTYRRVSAIPAETIPIAAGTPFTVFQHAASVEALIKIIET